MTNFSRCEHLRPSCFVLVWSGILKWARPVKKCKEGRKMSFASKQRLTINDQRFLPNRYIYIILFPFFLAKCVWACFTRWYILDNFCVQRVIWNNNCISARAKLFKMIYWIFEMFPNVKDINFLGTTNGNLVN